MQAGDIIFKRGDSGIIKVTLTPDEETPTFNGYTVLMTIKRQLDNDVNDSKAVFKDSIVIDDDTTFEVEFELEHVDTLFDVGNYYLNIRLVKNDGQESLSSENIIFSNELGATQRIE